LCGISGYTGFREAKDVIIECLKRLDYRGYDSAGIGILDKKIKIFKDIGEIAHLEGEIPEIQGDIGIGHTRWATHGAVTRENAHPQLSPNKKIAVIHNGIIENFKTLKEDLEKKGHKFTSQTDTEVIAQLIASLALGFHVLKKSSHSFSKVTSSGRSRLIPFLNSCVFSALKSSACRLVRKLLLYLLGLPVLGSISPYQRTNQGNLRFS